MKGRIIVNALYPCQKLLAFVPVARSIAVYVRRQLLVRVVVVVHPQANLLEIVGALAPSGRFACRLHRRQQQRDQDPNDRNDHQELDQGKTSSLRHTTVSKMDENENTCGAQAPLLELYSTNPSPVALAIRKEYNSA